MTQQPRIELEKLERRCEKLNSVRNEFGPLEISDHVLTAACCDGLVSWVRRAAAMLNSLVPFCEAPHNPDCFGCQVTALLAELGPQEGG